jgi:tRNA (guanine-N7-)-methyltransferase
MVVVYEDGFAGKGGWKSSFPAPGPLNVELGTGKGQFLREMAQSHPEACFVGLEKEPGILVQAVRQAQDMGLTNLKFILGDVQFLGQMFDVGEIDALYIHFCDPWPKNRHGKRRLTHETFLHLYRKVLAPSGIIRFKTDNRELFDYTLGVLREFDMELLTVSYDIHAEYPEGGIIMTEYEAKFSSAGLPVHYCEARFSKSTEGGMKIG